MGGPTNYIIRRKDIVKFCHLSDAYCRIEWSKSNIECIAKSVFVIGEAKVPVFLRHLGCDAQFSYFQSKSVAGLFVLLNLYIAFPSTLPGHPSSVVVLSFCYVSSI